MMEARWYEKAGGRLSLAGRGGRDGGHQDQLSVWTVLDFLPETKRELCLVTSEEFEIVLANAQFPGDCYDLLHLCVCGDFRIRQR